MRRGIGTNNGFTLFEMIVVLVLVAVIAVAAGLGMVHVVQGMVFTKMNAATVQKGQNALTKLVKEFNNLSTVTAATANSITFDSYKQGVLAPGQAVAFSGNTITFGGDTLTDQVSSFSLNYRDSYDSLPQTTWQSSRKIIEITIGLKGAGGAVSQLQARVTPRNLQ